MIDGKLILPAAAADVQAPKVEKPPANNPIESAWDVFERLAVPRNLAPSMRRALKHAFYAGARAAFFGVIDSMKEQDEGDPDGEKRFAAIETQIGAYWAQLAAAATVSRTGKVE